MRERVSVIRSIMLCLSVVALSWLNNGSLLAQSPSQEILEKLAVYPTMIVYNGKIASMDQNLSFHEAMAIRGDRIWMLGTNQEIRRLAGPQTELIDLKGRTVVPGLIDIHSHVHLWGWWHYGKEVPTELEPAYAHGKDVEEVKLNLKRLIQQRIQEKGKGKLVLVSVSVRMSGETQRFFQHGRVYPPGFDRSRITRADLDSIAPDTPVVLVTGCCGGFSNTKGRELLIQELGFDPAGRSPLVYNLVWGVILKGRTKEAEDLISREMRDFVKYGVTTTSTQGDNNTEVFKAWNKMDREGRMPARLAWSHRSGFLGSKDPSEYYRLLGDFLGQGSDFFWNVGVGEEGWDGEAASQCYSEIGRTPEQQTRIQSAPFPNCIPDDFVYYKAHLAAAEAGLRLWGLHNLSGDKVMDRVFAIAERAIQNGTRTLEDIRGQMWEFDHNSLVRPDQIPLIKKYGFTLDFQPTFFVKELYKARNFYKPEIVSWVTPLKSLLEAGVLFGIGTDVGISQLSDDEENFLNNLSDALPYRNSIWPYIGVWVQPTVEIARGEFGSGERRTEMLAKSSEQRIDRISALRAMTTWSAKILLREDRLGSLEPGKLADFVVIDKDYFTIPEPEIMNIKTLMTGLGGKIAYKDPNF